MWNKKFKYTALSGYAFLLTFIFNLEAQNPSNFIIKYLNDVGQIIEIKYQKSDSLLFQTKLTDLFYQKEEEGYLFVKIDSIQRDSNVFIYCLSTGLKFKLLRLENIDIVNLKNQISKNELLSPKKWVQLRNLIIRNDVENGYPLSKISLHDVKIIEDSLTAKIDYQRGPYFKYGPIEERNQIVVSERFLQRHLHIPVGRKFNYNVVRNVESNLSQIPYIEVQYPPRINFNGDEAIVYLYLKKKKNNTFDFLLGFNNKVTENSKSIQLTGQASFDLSNAFKIGERIAFHYENLQVNSPRINIKLEFPYLKFIPFGTGFDFSLQKYTDQYIGLQTKLKLQKFLNFGEEINVFVLNEFSYLLNIDTLFIKNNNRLPQALDYSYLAYGLGYKINKLNYLSNPTRGYTIEIQASLGRKQFIKNSNVLLLDNNKFLENQYDSLNRINLQSNIHFNSSYYYSLLKRQVIKLAVNSSILVSKAKILENEVFRIGGINTLRGFNDNLFASKAYIISTLEYRFLLDRNSYLLGFIDHSYMSIITQTTTVPWQNYFGIGIGMQLQTQAGAFGIYFAVGKTEQMKFDFAATKVHFGYTAKF
ncbi:MAG: hypothetical protein ABI851_01845 [Saprospiraceae bacterium]